MGEHWLASPGCRLGQFAKYIEPYIEPKDGAPIHCTDPNMAYLARQFGGRLLSRRSEPYGGRDWAARTRLDCPDLNPLDFG